jgi:hypothetical protein
VALELAEDRRHRVAGERDLALGAEAVDRLDQTQRGHLHEVLERLVGALVAAGELARQRHEALHERLAGQRVAVALVAQEQLAVLARALAAAGCGIAHVAHRPNAKRGPHRALGTLLKPPGWWLEGFPAGKGAPGRGKWKRRGSRARCRRTGGWARTCVEGYP